MMGKSKNTLIIGATTNTERYAYLAAERLTLHQHNIFLYGVKSGKVFGKEIVNNKDLPQEKIDTITMYIGAKHQPEWYDFIFNLNPKRIIFNPGTENEELMNLAEAKNIEVVEGCTLVMLGSGVF